MVDDTFWSPRIEAAVEATLPHTVAQCVETASVANLAQAAGLEAGPHAGRRDVDSDLFKVMEGLAWRMQRGDRDSDGELDKLIELATAAQEDDRYLFTIRTIAATGSNDRCRTSAADRVCGQVQPWPDCDAHLDAT